MNKPITTYLLTLGLLAATSASLAANVLAQPQDRHRRVPIEATEPGSDARFQRHPSFQVDGSELVPEALDPAIAAARAEHVAVLRDNGIHDLHALGKLTLSGNIAVQPGIAVPSNLADGSRRYDIRAGTRRQGDAFQPLTGKAELLPANPLRRGVAGDSRVLVFREAADEVRVATAYIAADWLDLPDGTNLVLVEGSRRLVILARKLTVGENVTLTYDRQVPESPPATQPTPGKPGKPSRPDHFSEGYRGTAGTAGATGARGYGRFADAPRVELWTVEMQGMLAVDFRGQDGGSGSRGGNGGPGGDGGDGSVARNATVGCKRGPGAGGRGGDGGRAGDGGHGGDGATGGAFRLYAPASAITAITTNGFFVSVDPGQGGPGGPPGTPGGPGAGGSRGSLTSMCGDHGRGTGAMGSQGAPGVPGPAGEAGARSSSQPVQFIPIIASDFYVAWMNPALETVTPKSGAHAYEGEPVTVAGRYFAAGDRIEVANGASWVPAETKILGDKLATFTVPVVEGGLRSIRLRRSTGTVSNEASLSIGATVARTDPERMTPGGKARVVGTGFTQNMRVLVNGYESDGEPKLLDPHTLEFQVVRPQSGVEANAAGETVKVAVDLNGTASGTVDAILDTIVVGDVGDSILGGPGLDEYDRIVSQVERALAKLPGNPGIYVRTFAHTGAKIGITPQIVSDRPPRDRQVPTTFPTVREQVLAFAASPDLDPIHTDLLIVNGCNNDVEIEFWMDPKVEPAAIQRRAEQHCYRDMLTLLELVAARFPAARVVVVGTYSPVGPESNEVRLVPLLSALDSKWYNIPPNVFGTLGREARERILENCRTFVDAANGELARAVGDINLRLGGAIRFFFAHPRFGPQNAAEAGSDAWVFGIDTLSTGVLVPQDPPSVREQRARACREAGFKGVDLEFCKRASAGHPNQAGAKVYVAAILAELGLD